MLRCFRFMVCVRVSVPGARGGSRYPERRHRACLPQAGGRAPATAGARAAAAPSATWIFRSARGGYLDIEKLAPAAARRGHAVDRATSSRSTKDETRLPKPRVAADADVARIRPVLRILRRGARRTSPGRSFRTPRTWSGTRRCSTSCSNTRSTRTAPRFSIRPGLERLAARVVTVLRFLPPGGAVRAFEFTGDPGTGAARSALAPGRAALRRTGLLPHSGWHRPPAVPALPGDSVPPLSRAGRGGDRVHGGALDHADRLGLRSGARMRSGFRR